MSTTRRTANEQMGRYLVKYVAIVAYGILALIEGLPTLRAIGGEWLTLVWPIFVIIIGLLAIVGVVESWRLHRDHLERIVTFILCILLWSYSVWIGYKALVLHDGPFASALLPFMISVMPYARFLDLSPKRNARRGGRS